MRRMNGFFLRDLPRNFEEGNDGADALECYDETGPEMVFDGLEMKVTKGKI